MKNIAAVFLSLCLLLSGCQAKPVPAAGSDTVTAPTTVTPTSQASELASIPATVIEGSHLTLYVEPSITHQTIQDATGGNFINVFSGTTDPTEAVSRYNLAHLPIKVARVRMTLEAWEPVNDDTDPSQFRWEAFQDAEYNHATFLLMQELEKRGTEIIASSWDLPDWLVSDPLKSTDRFVPYENYPEVVEIVAAWLVTAREEYGVEPRYISFNEPDVGAYISLAPFEMSMLIEQAGKRFEELGLKTQWLIADTATIDGSRTYAQSVLKEEAIHPYLGVFANHSWDSDSPDSVYLQVRAFALENDLEVWCTEAGTDAFAWQTPDIFPTYAYAIDLARNYSRLLKLSGANTLLYWEMMGADYWINDGTHPYPAFHVIRMLGEQIPPGAVIVETSNNTEVFYSVAAQAPEHFALFMVNSGSEALTISVEGLPEGEYAHFQTTETALELIQGTYNVPDGEVTLQVPGKSLQVLTTRKP